MTSDRDPVEMLREVVDGLDEIQTHDEHARPLAGMEHLFALKLVLPKTLAVVEAARRYYRASDRGVCLPEAEDALVGLGKALDALDEAS